MATLHKKKVIVGITGGIAAYKIPILVRQLRKQGAEVRIVMTDAAAKFVSPITLATLSGAEVLKDIWPRDDAISVRFDTWHIGLGRWADIMIVAPATANTIAKLAHGFADNALTTIILALRCPLIIAPAMDTDMWENIATRTNIATLRERGYMIIPPDEGELASGLVGPGRLPEMDRLEEAIITALSGISRDLAGRTIVVSAGPTHEAIDPVRFIGNRSSGKMGFAIASAAVQRGADVTLITGPVHLATPASVRRIDVETARQMKESVLRQSKHADAVIMAAAVADFRPKHPAGRKIKKEHLQGTVAPLELEATEDILTELGTLRRRGVTVGFALETHDGVRNAKAKLRAKNLDLIVLNNPLEKGAGFGTETNIVTLIPRKGKIERLKKMPKIEVAHAILDRVVRLLPS